MGKLSQLTGVANNLADSFVSVTNMAFLGYIAKLPIEQSKLIEINLLDKTISPESIKANITKKVIQNYSKWFSNEIKKLELKLTDMDKVSIKVVYKPGKIKARYYTCNVTISAKGKKYTKKVMSTFA